MTSCSISTSSHWLFLTTLISIMYFPCKSLAELSSSNFASLRKLIFRPLSPFRRSIFRKPLLSISTLSWRDWWDSTYWERGIMVKIRNRSTSAFSVKASNGCASVGDIRILGTKAMKLLKWKLTFDWEVEVGILLMPICCDRAQKATWIIWLRIYRNTLRLRALVLRKPPCSWPLSGHDLISFYMWGHRYIQSLLWYLSHDLLIFKG